ncbi:hypothetical protein C8R43DRAFT_1239510 [Mycena crocata]|nr:hypothetical protein C8R43DRAFT_1239510 [Mycena crocata]
MHLFSLVALCLISGRPAFSQPDSKWTPKAGLDAQTVTLTQPSPTSTDPSVLGAYTTYSQKCGADLNTATQSALQTYEKVTSKTGVSINDEAFVSWAATGFPAYMQATSDCTNALLAYKDALSSSGGPSSTTSSSKPSSPPASSNSPTPSSPSPSPASAASLNPSWALALGGLAAAFYLPFT